jgi:hypothetical protein
MEAQQLVTGLHVGILAQLEQSEAVYFITQHSEVLICTWFSHEEWDDVRLLAYCYFIVLEVA